MSEKQKINICSAKDFDISYYCGSGPGGQARNKVASGVQLIHFNSGAIGRASDSRSQSENKKNAFLRLIETPKFKFWLAKKKFEIKNQQTIEESLDKELSPENLKIEIQQDGKWMEVSANFKFTDND